MAMPNFKVFDTYCQLPSRKIVLIQNLTSSAYGTVSSQPCQHSALWFFLVFTNLRSEKWCLFVVLINSFLNPGVSENRVASICSFTQLCMSVVLPGIHYYLHGQCYDGFAAGETNLYRSQEQLTSQEVVDLCNYKLALSHPCIWANKKTKFESCTSLGAEGERNEIAGR